MIAYLPGTAFKFSFVSGSLVWLGILVGLLIVLFGLFLWIQPSLKNLLGTLIIVFSLASFMSSDFGGLLIGMLLGLIGGALAIAWMPATVMSGRISTPIQPAEVSEADLVAATPAGGRRQS